jgi:hypothetical protein
VHINEYIDACMCVCVCVCAWAFWLCAYLVRLGAPCEPLPDAIQDAPEGRIDGPWVGCKRAAHARREEAAVRDRGGRGSMAAGVCRQGPRTPASMSMSRRTCLDRHIKAHPSTYGACLPMTTSGGVVAQSHSLAPA